MPQVVQPDRGQASKVGKLLERAGHGGRVQGRAVGAGELEVRPGRWPAADRMLLVLMLTVGADDRDSPRVQGHLAFPGFGFRGAVLGGPAVLTELEEHAGVWVGAYDRVSLDDAVAAAKPGVPFQLTFPPADRGPRGV